MKGSALAYVLVVMFIVMIIFTSMITFVTSQIKFSFYQEEKEQAFQIAESGINFYNWYLAHQTSGKTAEQIASFWSTGDPLGLNTPYEADYEGIGGYRIEVEPPVVGSTIVEVTSTGWAYRAPNNVSIVKVRFRRPSWSEYTFLSNDVLSFGTGATVYGKVHSNKGIRFDGVAYNLVTSLVPSYDDPSHGPGQIDSFGVHTHVNPADPDPPSYPWASGTVPSRPDVFKAGREFPVPEVSFSGVTSDLANMKYQAQNGNGVYFNNAGYGRRIKLKTDGTFDVCTVNQYSSSSLLISTNGSDNYLRTSGSGTCGTCSGACMATYTIPNNGVIFVEDNAWVEGSINNKRVSIVAANLSGGGNQADIYIGYTNIRYSNYDCNNIIGLVAQNDIAVIRDCPNDFIVDAALLAQNGEVYRDPSSSNKNSLTFNGAMSSYNQPYFNNGNNGFGIRTYNFDNNLLYCPPPFFPTGTEYAVDLWQQLK